MEPETHSAISDDIPFMQMDPMPPAHSVDGIPRISLPAPAGTVRYAAPQVADHLLGSHGETSVVLRSIMSKLPPALFGGDR
jgi:hypothetical protein